MSSDFWAKKIGNLATPRPQQPPQTVPQAAWWQDSAPSASAAAWEATLNQPQYAGQGYPYNPSLQAQMPGMSSDGPGSHAAREQHVRQLMRTPADQLTQEQMETIATWELENRQEYNRSCPQCGSANFAPAGTKLGSTKLGSDKCFDCGASSSTYTGSPEPARGGGSASKARRLDIRQIDTGGAVESMYMRFDGVPAGYVPRK